MAAGKRKIRGNEIIDLLNVNNAKLIAVCLVIGFSIYNGVRHLKHGLDSCSLIMNDGRYIGKKDWQPYGCMMHTYQQLDTKRCFKLLHFLGHYNRVSFVGDSRIFHLYGAFVKTIDNHATFKHNQTQYYINNDLGVKVEYFFAPYLSHPMNSNIVDYVSHWKVGENVPNFVVIGYGVEDILNSEGSPKMLHQFKYNLTKFAQTIDSIVNRETKVIWTLQEPINAGIKPAWNGLLNNSVINLYNNAAVEILRYTKAFILTSHFKLSAPFLNEMTDGLHLFSDHKAKKSGAQILLNIYCNDHMNFYDGSCCSSPESPTTLQKVTFVILFLCLLSAIVAFVYERYKRNLGARSELVKVIFALGKLALIMLYFYICDRTNFFMKETKYYSKPAFWISIVYVFCVGLFFTENSRYSKVLHRDQTDEWKGWMQIVILIFQWTDTMRDLPIAMHLRMMGSSFLFLNGYGHFFYFWQTGDGGVIRFFQILFRYNFMAFTLCLCMNEPYQSYYFIPLISFWFLMMYIFLVLPPHITSISSDSHPIQYLYLVLKFVGLFGIITTLYMSEVFFEKIFVTRPWKALFVTTDDDIHRWWSIWKLDRYSLSYGMIFAAAFLLSKRFSLLDDNNHNNLFSNGLSLSATLVSLIGIGSYTAFTLLCRDAEECCEIHSYAVFVPILGFIVLRNISGVLRTRYSTFFAWFGKISLELYIAQCHIWLARDSKGTLALVPEYKNLNLFVTSFIFICVAHEMHEITNTLLPYAVPTDMYSLVKNVLLFFTILVPIGIHDGMF